PVRGPAFARVTIVEYADFQCPHSAAVQATLQKVLASHGQDVRIAFKHNPLPIHSQALLAAQAALAAAEQGKFWEMHDQLFAHPQALDRPAIERYAAAIGLDLARFKADLDSGKFNRQI